MSHAPSSPPNRGPGVVADGHAEDVAAPGFFVSVIVGEATDGASLEATLASVQGQTLGAWELVRSMGTSPPPGSQPWLLFLDAGDILAPTMLARVREVLASDPTLDAVHCGWTVAGRDGRPLFDERCDAEGDLFDLLACRRAFPSSACVVRRTVVGAAGRPDQALGDAVGWTFWQRIARRGARFGRVGESLVTWRATVRSTPAEQLRTALEVIALGHRSDPGVALPAGAPYAAGRLARPDEAEVNALCAAAGTALARDGEVAALLALLPLGRRLVDVDAAAAEIARAVLIAAEGAPAALAALWPTLVAPLGAFLATLERCVERPGLARAIAAAVQRLVLAQLLPPLPPPVDGTQIAVIDAEAPVDDVHVEDGVEVVQLLVRLERAVLGAIELPVVDGRVTSSAIRAAVAARWADRVLARFLATRGHLGGLVDLLWERDPPLYARVADAIDHVSAALRWTDDGRHRGPPRTVILKAGCAVPRFVFGRRNIAVELRAAGTVGLAEVIVGPLGVVSGRALRTAGMAAAGPALVRAVVGELVIGAPLTDVGATSPSASRRRRS